MKTKMTDKYEVKTIVDEIIIQQVRVNITETVDCKKAVAIKIKEKRKQLKMTQRDVADRFGTAAENGISRMESGNYYISIESLEKLCKIFNCKSSEILPF